MMKAHEPIDRASFGPDALKAIGRAFDESWFSIAGNFAKDQIETLVFGLLTFSYRSRTMTAAMLRR
jgi:hypothetical protein